jgi:hypothetical protein
MTSYFGYNKVANILLTISLSMFASSVCVAYPVIVEGARLNAILGSTRSNIAVIAANVDPSKPFQQLLHQFDEVEEAAALVLRNPQVELSIRKEHPHPSKRDPFKGRFEDVHRLTLDDNEFTQCTPNCLSRVGAEARRICGMNEGEGFPIVQRLDLKFRKTTAFVVACDSPVKEIKKLADIKIDMKARTFQNSLFSYKYKSKKSIFFEEVAMPPGGQALLQNSELQIFLKPKYLFNINFSEKDIVSRITSITQGNLSTGVEVAFAMDVLNFKVNSQICCDVSIYKDALYFPVMLDLPFDGNSFKPGSGLYYGFDYTGDFKKDAKVFAERLSDYKFGEKRALPRQAKGTSAVLMNNNGKLMGVGFRSAKTLPDFTAAPTIAFPEDLKKIDFAEVKSKVGLFYDITSLAKGFHHFNVWFYAGESSKEEIISEYVKNGIEFEVSQVYQ